MQVIVSHVNTDFDALASMFAAKKLYPDATVALSDKKSTLVKQFLTIYRETLDFVQETAVDWSQVTELILVDTASIDRTGIDTAKLSREHVHITVYDHHPAKEGDVIKDDGIIEATGAAVTLLIEEIQKHSLSISSFEANLFGLGIYTDTGSFTFSNTTARDFRAAAYLLTCGMQIEMVQRFSGEMLESGQQELLNELFRRMENYHVEGLHIVVSTYDYGTFQKGLATVTQKLLEVTEADAIITVVGMKKRVFIVGRARSERINLLPLLKKWHGGGHEEAGSASVKNGNHEAVLHDVVQQLPLIFKPALTAKDMMTTSVKTISPDATIEEAGHLMYRYGHSGFPVVKDEELVGIITRRDLEKANHHGLGHAPVKAYMSTEVVTIEPETTEEEIQQITIERDIGRLPVISKGKLVGIISRTNIIEAMHRRVQNDTVLSSNQVHVQNVSEMMKTRLPNDVYSLLLTISESAKKAEVQVYLIGGIVRDLFLQKENHDIDIVVEGDGIYFAKKIQNVHGGEVTLHENFGTATWIHPNGVEVDITSSRLEYYDRPAALPHVEKSTLKEDLYRRDFAMNAMAVDLNTETFGQIIDPFKGQLDIYKKRLTVLHNLSFVEDPTRILRGIRFEQRFQFVMDEQTEQLARHSMNQMKDVSANRIVEEMKLLFYEADPKQVIQRLFELTFWQQFEVKKKVAASSYNHAQVLQALYQNDDIDEPPSWFSYFLIPFYHGNKLESAESFALTKKETKLLREVYRLKDVVAQMNLPIEKAGEYHRYFCDFSSHAILFVTAIKDTSIKESVGVYVQQRQQLQSLLTGKNLMKYGLKPGAYFKEILFELDIAMLNKEVTTKEDAEAWLKRQMDKRAD